MSPGNEDLEHPLTDADWDRLDAILQSLGELAELDLEGLDGLIAANACGPRGISPVPVLANAFRDGDFPKWASEDDFRDFISLSLRRMNEYVRFFGIDKSRLTLDNVVSPVILDTNQDELATVLAWKPDEAAVRADTRRPGRWPGQAWARGFMRVHGTYADEWSLLDDFEDGALTLAPLMMLDVGYSPDHPEQPFDPERWIVMLPLVARDVDGFCREKFVQDSRSREPYRAPPKVGRNDPCPCGSGRKYKRCCGAAT